MDEPPIDPLGVAAWRRATRERLIAARVALSVEAHRAASRGIDERLTAHFSDLASGLTGFYWPFRREFDALPFARRLIAAGGAVALPVVRGKGEPLEFRRWQPGTKMNVGVYDIPYPAEGKAVRPTALLVALLGFDREAYRLGYGAGYYDRTIAAMVRRPRIIGIGFELGRLETVRPQPHDFPMDFIVTESTAARRADGALAPL